MCKNTSEADPIPIIKQGYDGYWLIDDDNGKRYAWEYVEGIILEAYGRDLAKMLAIQHWNIGGMTLIRIGIIECGSAGYSAPWNLVSPMEPEISRLLRSDSCKSRPRVPGNLTRGWA